MNASLKMLAVAATTVAAAFSPVLAATPSPDCVVKSRNEGLVLMHCSAKTDDKLWVDAAKSACGLAKVCNVWIWDDLSKIPATAPKTDAGLSKNATGSALAVWVNDSSSLMKLKKAK